MVTRLNRARNNLQAHYTTSLDIVSYMCSRLSVSSDDIVWEPCAGQGHLIDGVLRYAGNHVRVVANEVDSSALMVLRSKYTGVVNVDVRPSDALQEPVSEKFTRVIANPPYGAWQEPGRRRELKQRFGDLYVKDSYAVFLYYALLKSTSGGRLVFIVPDTFLWLHRHQQLRLNIFSTATVEEIALFPSFFFPGIQFGYSGLCVITIRNTPPDDSHEIRIVRDIRNASVLTKLAHGCLEAESCHIDIIAQSTIASHRHCALMLNFDHGLGTGVGKTLGDVANVVTGFYSGNDGKWIRQLCGGSARSSYLQVTSEDVTADTAQGVPLDGIADSRCFVPVVRGGAAQFVKPTRFFVDWSREAVAEYRRKGSNPARFQNSKYYFRQGIAVPMVASARMTAALIDHRLFDQGIVGIFPHDERLLWFILGFLNTSLATELIRGINPTANNSANYLKRLPFVLPTDDELHSISAVVRQLVEIARQPSELPLATMAALENSYRHIWARREVTTDAAPVQPQLVFHGSTP